MDIPCISQDERTCEFRSETFFINCKSPKTEELFGSSQRVAFVEVSVSWDNRAAIITVSRAEVSNCEAFLSMHLFI